LQIDPKLLEIKLPNNAITSLTCAIKSLEESTDS